MTPVVSKVPVVTRPEYVLLIEMYQGLPFVHCDVLVRWSKTVKRKFLADWQELNALMGQPIFAVHPKDDAKHLKFLRLCSFIYVADILGLDGIVRELHMTQMET